MCKVLSVTIVFECIEIAEHPQIIILVLQYVLDSQFSPQMYFCWSNYVTNKRDTRDVFFILIYIYRETKMAIRS